MIENTTRPTYQHANVLQMAADLIITCRDFQIVGERLNRTQRLPQLVRKFINGQRVNTRFAAIDSITVRDSLIFQGKANLRSKVFHANSKGTALQGRAAD